MHILRSQLCLSHFHPHRGFHSRLNCLAIVLNLLVWAASSLPSYAQESHGSKTRKVVARVGDLNIYEDDLLPLIQAQLRPLQDQEYQIRSQALEKLIQDKLLEIDAAKAGVTKEKLLQQEVDSKIAEPSDSEVSAYYLAVKDRINLPLADVRPQVRDAVKQARTQEARQVYMNSLRAKFSVAVLLQRPRVEVAHDLARMKGNSAAPVTIVEFSDFQCPFCQKVNATLYQILAKYEGSVRLSFRDFPLQQHPQAIIAAEAARCATEQGKFWEYHDALFANPVNLDKQGLIERARSLKLDIDSFDTCLNSGKYKAQIEQDIRDGMKAGVAGTPAFFVNGVFLSGMQMVTVFEKIIDEELATAARSRQ